MRLLVCHHHRLFLDALCAILTDRGHAVVATALEPREAVAAAMEHQPDVCLLDMSPPHAIGLNAVGRIHKVSPDTKVVILSGSISSSLVADAIAQGAQGFVDQHKPFDVLLEALELAHQGHLAVDPSLLQGVFRPHAQRDDPLRALKFLTAREWEVLQCLVDGLSTEQMAGELAVRPSTVRAHVQTLLTKLGVHSRLQAAALMTGHFSNGSVPDVGILAAAVAANGQGGAEPVQVRSQDSAADNGAITAVQEAVLGEAQLSAAPTTREVVSLSERGRRTTPGAKVTARLTARELEVLCCLGQGLSGNEIGVVLQVSPNTVRTHRRNILRKLNADPGATEVALARRA